VRPSTLAAAVVIALCLTPASSAQSPAPPPSPQTPAQTSQPADQRPPTFKTGANLVRVDVYPTRDGKPVLDLAATDFEILEDGVAQKVDSFEHVVVRPAGPQSERIEPSSQREMQQAAENPRNRVFVIFLDQTHVRFEDSHAITEPLIRLINRILGPDDLVGVMTPDMSASELVLSRRTEVTEERLRTHWRWGDRFARMNDEREDAYLLCYGPGDLADAMIARKRERETLEALQDLVRYLNGLRDERKAVLTVTDGWVLFTPRSGLENGGLDRGVPTVDPVGVGPNGKLTTKDPRDRDTNNTSTKMECDADRQRLAAIDDEQFVKDIINEANRSNATFYPIDPRGLVVFQTGICGDSGVRCEPVPLAADAQLRRMHELSIRSLADGTDGIAVMDTNDLDKGLQRISDDLTSYYLLGYYSTNSKTDGGYRALKVRVKRPGVAVRARRGYRAASAEEVARARKAAATPAVDTATPISAAMDALASIRPDSRVRLRATATPGGDVLWIAGELSAATGRADEWAQGATANLQISSGAESALSRVTIKAGDRTFLTSVKLPAGKPATIDVQARISPTDGGAAPATESIRLAASPQPLFYRRGPSTANRQVPTADLRFTRADRAHIELPVVSDVKPGSGRLLDRAGQALTVPVTVGERIDEATGQHWIIADVTLAPLAPADYVIEIGTIEKTGESRVVAGIRVVR
jgi:VWFA-related protein